MRVVLALVLLLGAGAAWALETARALADAGATRLALARVEALQPRELNAPRWPEWESLHIRLLVAAGRNEDALRRAEALPPGMPPQLLRESLMAAARAAVASGQGAAARRHLARVIWQLEPAVDELRGARLLVIDSYLSDRQGQQAFLAMLRFQQDYSPLDEIVAERFVGGLLVLDMEKQAVNWLAALNDTGPTKMRLRLRLGLIEPAAAVKQARARLAKGGEPALWGVLADAARREGDAALRAEALEQLLNSDEPAASIAPAVSAATLWETYGAVAADTAKKAKTKQGDDAARAGYAARQVATAPSVARAVYADLAVHAGQPQARLSAQRQLVQSLQQSGLERAALRLFGALKLDEASLDPEARRLLGTMAERARRPDLALRYWKGLAAAPGTPPEEWQARRAAAYWQAGEADAALGELRGVVEPPRPLPAEVGRLLTSLTLQMAAAGKTGPADRVLGALLAGADTKTRRELLFELGQAAARGGHPQAAPGYYLRSAALDGGKAPDALALQARLAAGRSLAQAGFRDDARAQYQWVVRNSKDAAQAEVARRELAKL